MPPPDPSAYARRIVVRGRVFEAPDAETADRILETVPERLRTVVSRDSPEAAEERRLGREYGDSPLRAGGAAALRGATLGLSDAAIAGIGGEEAQTALRELERRNAAASVLGEIGGAVAPVLLTGGIGAAAEGTAGLGSLVRGIGTPTRLLAGASEAAGSAVARGLGRAGAGLGRRLGARVAGAAVEGGIEGAVGEGGRMLTEAAIGTGDPDLTAERVLARLGMGALLGSATGGLVGTGSGLLGEAVSGATGRVGAAADVLRRSWSDSIGTELSPGVARAWAAVADAGEAGGDALRRFAGLGAEGRRLRRLVESGDEVYEAGTRSIGGHLDAMENALARATPYWREGLRREELVGLVDASRIADQAASARALSADIRDRVEALATDFHGSPVGGMARGLGRSIDRRMSEIELAIANSDGAALNAELNQIKREVDALIARSEGLGPVAGALRETNDGIRRSLEDGAVWGDGAAAAQREINEAFASWLTTRDAFRRRFTTDGASAAGRLDSNPFQRIPEANSAALRGFLGGVGTAANETGERTFGESIESGRRLLDVMERHLGLDPAARAAVTEARAASDELLATFRRVRSDASDLNQWNRLAGSGGLARGLLGGAVGAAVAGPVGAIALGAATNPAHAIRTLGLLERWSSGATSDIAASVGRFLGAASGRARRAVTETARRGRTAAVLGGVTAYRARVRQLEQDAADPGAMTTRLAGRVAELDRAPRVRDALVGVAARGSAYLQSIRPGGRADPGQIVPTTTAPPSSSEVSAFLRAARAVDNPMTVLEDLDRGTLTADAVRALRAVYPRLFQQIVGEVTRQIAERGSDIPYERRLSLGLLLGVPTDPSLVPARIALMQAAYITTPAAPPSARRPAPSMSGSTATGSEAAERRDAA